MAKKSVKSSAKKPMGRTWNVLGIVSAVISMLFLPPIFGIIAVILGFVGYKKGDKKLGTWAMILGVVLAIIGMLLGLWASGYFG